MLSHLLNQPAVVVGDLVASRRAVDRAALHDDLLAALAAANTATAPAERLGPTIGDEFQGVFHSALAALYATLLVRASMPRAHDVRFGVGIGEVIVLGEAAHPFRHQDGPGWWAARDAIDHISAGRGVPRSLRTWLHVAPRDYGQPDAARRGVFPEKIPPDVRTVNAYLATRDQLVTLMDDRDRRILRALLLGHSLTSAAEAEDVSVSAASQRVHRSGAAELLFTQSLLGSGG